MCLLCEGAPVASWVAPLSAELRTAGFRRIILGGDSGSASLTCLSLEPAAHLVNYWGGFSLRVDDFQRSLENLRIIRKLSFFFSALKSSTQFFLKNQSLFTFMNIAVIFKMKDPEPTSSPGVSSHPPVVFLRFL